MPQLRKKMPQAKRESLGALDYTYTIAEVPWVGGADADVYTKPGRYTAIRIEANNLRIGDDRKSIYVDVTYEVTELNANCTQLRWFGPVRIPSPYDSEITQFVNVTDFSLKTTIEGVNQIWNDLPVNTPNSCVSSVRAKIDGMGSDDLGNAQLELTFHIPVRFKQAH